MKIQNASFFDIGADLRVVYVAGTTAVKVQQRTNKPMATPFDKPVEEVLLDFSDIQAICNAVNSLKITNDLEKWKGYVAAHSPKKGA